MYLVRTHKVQLNSSNPQSVILSRSFKLHLNILQAWWYYHFPSFEVYKHKSIILCERRGRSLSKSQLKTLNMQLPWRLSQKSLWWLSVSSFFFYFLIYIRFYWRSGFKGVLPQHNPLFNKFFTKNCLEIQKYYLSLRKIVPDCNSKYVLTSVKIKQEN